ncbi:outer membrane protein assembly factor BamB family protein [Streptomyces jumonjinensis]|uniref:outer membrane protein assembly factor BamB family protein n=1 Tax=Streptomyces jumonjinensis TaxID=1945 RepID=UPI0037B2AE7C
MSQPPSQQPPGGFGAPQDWEPEQQWEPPPAQPGAPPAQSPPIPLTPPAQPGPYHQPAGPYRQQPGPYGEPASPYGEQYGQPGPYEQQPGPYGQQPGPYQQQPGTYHGYGPYDGYQGGGPQHPYPYAAPAVEEAAPAPTPPGGGFFKGRRVLVVAVGVAALLTIGGGSYLVLGGDDAGAKDKKESAGGNGDPEPADSPSAGRSGGGKSGGGAEKSGDLNAGRADGEAEIAFVTVNDVDLPRSGVDAFGPWVAGDTVVRAMYKQVVGYSAADGRKKWTLPLSTEVCSATLQPSAKGKIVIGVKDGLSEKAECLDLRMIDLKTGEVGWKKTLRTGEGFNSLTDFTLTISGNTLGAAGLGNSFGFSMTDGKQLFKGPVRGCKPFAFAGGPKLLAAAGCPTDDWNKPKQRLQEINAATGKAKWTYQTPEGWEIDKVFSVSPVVFSLKQSQEKKWGVVALNEDGTERSRIQGGKDKFQPRCGGTFVVLGENLEGCTGVAADQDTFYMATESAKPGGPNEVVAFDLDSGKAKWRSPSGGDSTIMPLRMEGGKVLAYRAPTWDKGGVLATIAPSGGAPRTLMKFQDATAQAESTFYSPRMVYEDGRFFIASGRVSARNDEEEMETRTMMAFTR